MTSYGLSVPPSEAATLLTQQIRKKDEGPRFTSTFGLVMASLGCMVGSGNVWRFSKAAAQNSEDKGCLVFIIIWLIFLFLWSIPLAILEYGIGRHTKVTLIKSFKRMMGENFIWCGIWMSVVSFFIACYYAVIVGWCLYYIFIFIAHPLPTTHIESYEIFHYYTKDTGWPYVTLAITLILSGVINLGGITSVEKVNMVFVPITFILLLVIFIWAMTRHAAVEGLKFLFKPNWHSFMSARVWGEAALQNLLTVGAGMGLLLTYANFLTSDNGVVKYGTLVTTGNHVISLLSAMMFFSLTFSTFHTHNVTNVTTANISEIMALEGPGGTGITFTWLPIVFSEIGFTGRLLCILFYLALFFLGMATMSAFFLVALQNWREAFLVPRSIAIFIMMSLSYCVGLASVMNDDFLLSQDKIWNTGLVISAFFLVVMAVVYGISKLRERGYNERSTNDWNLPVLWEWVVRYLVPIQAILILVWWDYDVITEFMTDHRHWYQLSEGSYFTFIISWVGLLFLCWFLNFCVVCCRPHWFMALEDDLWEEESLEGLYGTRESMLDPPPPAPGVYDMPGSQYGALDEAPNPDEEETIFDATSTRN